MSVFTEELGVELEAGMVRKGTRSPVNVLDLIDDGITTGRPFEALQYELGAWMAEFSTPVCRTVRDVENSFSRLEDLVPKGSELVFETCPFGLNVPLTAKPRYALVCEALAREHKSGALNPRYIAPWCSTQFHFGVGDVSLPEALLLLNFLNNIAPYARLQVVQKYGVMGAEGHLAIWTEPPSSKKERVPAPRWFGSFDELHRFVANIPKLVTKNADGVWVIAEGIQSRIGDPEAEGTIWWHARLRGLLKTVEWRVFPSLTPVQAADLAGHMFTLIGAFGEYVAAHPGAWHTKEEAAGLYQHLARSSYPFSFLVPPEPLSDGAWWAMTYDHVLETAL